MLYWWFVILSIAAGWSFCLIYQNWKYKADMKMLKDGIKNIKEIADETEDNELREEIEDIEEMALIIKTAETLAYWLELMQKNKLIVKKNLTQDEWLDVAVTSVENPEEVKVEKKKSRDN